MLDTLMCKGNHTGSHNSFLLDSEMLDNDQIRHIQRKSPFLNC